MNGRKSDVMEGKKERRRKGIVGLLCAFPNFVVLEFMEGNICIPFYLQANTWPIRELTMRKFTACMPFTEQALSL